MDPCVDEIGFGGLKLIQDKDSFRYGVDAVLLADFASCGKSDRVCDLGSASGVVPLIVHAKYGPEYIAGIEKQKDICALAKENVILNGLEGKIEFFCEDVLNTEHVFPEGSFDLVTSNPPYVEKGCGLLNPDSPKLIARHETSAGLEDFIKAASYLLKPQGSLCLVHRPQRLADIFCMGRTYGLEPKLLRMVEPHAGQAPNIVLVRLVKGGKKQLTVLPELPVRLDDGSYTPEMKKIYETYADRTGQTL